MQKNGYTFTTVYNSKCVSVFLHQTIIIGRTFPKLKIPIPTGTFLDGNLCATVNWKILSNLVTL